MEAVGLRWSEVNTSYKHAHSFFEGEAAMAAENERIEDEARELIKKTAARPLVVPAIFLSTV
jgi:hypothetical protein